MNRTTERICAGHYLIKTRECGQFSASKHDGEWNLRKDGHLIGRFRTKKEAMAAIGEQQTIARRENWKATQAAWASRKN